MNAEVDFADQSCAEIDEDALLDPNPPASEYGERAELRKVGQQGEIYLADRPWKVSRALVSETVQLQRVGAPDYAYITDDG